MTPAAFMARRGLETRAAQHQRTTRGLCDWPKDGRVSGQWLAGRHDNVAHHAPGSLHSKENVLPHIQSQRDLSMLRTLSAVLLVCIPCAQPPHRRSRHLSVRMAPRPPVRMSVRRQMHPGNSISGRIRASTSPPGRHPMPGGGMPIRRAAGLSLIWVAKAWCSRSGIRRGCGQVARPMTDRRIWSFLKPFFPVRSDCPFRAC